jgi:rubrerythrin
MGVFFSGSEMLEIAMEIEKSGITFYDTLARRTQNKEISARYKYLSGEEKKHLAAFQKMVDSAGEYQPPESYPGEYMRYIKSLVDNAVFKDVDTAQQKVQEISSNFEAIDIGIQAEKDSILFYTELQEVVSKSDRNIVTNILKAEKDHLRQLCDLKAMISEEGGKTWE